MYVCTQLYLTVFNPMDCSPPDSSVYRIILVRILEWVVISSSGDLPDPGTELASPVSPALWVDSLPASHQGSLCITHTRV